MDCIWTIVVMDIHTIRIGYRKPLCLMMVCQPCMTMLYAVCRVREKKVLCFNIILIQYSYDLFSDIRPGHLL